MISRLSFARRLVARQLDDTCIVLSRTGGGRNARGYKQADYTAGAQQLCKFDATATGEIAGTTTATGTISGIAYFPLHVVIHTSDRITLTHVNGDGRTPGTGEALAVPQVFEVVGPPKLEPTCLAVQLQAVVEGTGV